MENLIEKEKKIKNQLNRNFETSQKIANVRKTSSIENTQVD